MPEKIELIRAACPDCRGSGYTSKKREKFCPSCKGAGTVLADPADTEDCDKCDADNPGFTEPGIHCTKCVMTGKIIVKKKTDAAK
jgi:RecJ-like exonuclease